MSLRKQCNASYHGQRHKVRFLAEAESNVFGETVL